MDEKNHDWCGCGKTPGKRKFIKIIWIIVIVFIITKIFSFDGGRNDNSQKDTIVVAGKGELTVKPDIATVSFSVTQENLDVSKASDVVNTKIAKVIDTLKVDGVDEKDIKTTGYNIYPRYNYVNSQAYPYGGGTQVLAAYVVTQNIDIKIRDLSKAGKVVTDLSVLNVTDISGLNFTNDKYDDLVRQARDEAIADARSQAEKLAKALGVRLVKIVAFSENGNYPVPYGMGGGFAGIATKESVAPAVLPTGENKITSNVSVTYEIR